ncbi:MAG TPA: single-stranded DNA-binding protein [Beutenbergiaceae bacterium]|nr:single-stranded DNA-binding protein [Beutenbergiaceae bacterium]
MNDVRMVFRGNAGDKPQLWTTGTRPFARVNVASTPRLRIDGEWQDGDTQWIQVKAWGRLAHNMAASIRKGDAVIVTGTFRLEEYTNDQGQTFKTAVVHASGVGFDLVRTCAMAAEIRKDEDPDTEAASATSGSSTRSWETLDQADSVSEEQSQQPAAAPF